MTKTNLSLSALCHLDDWGWNGNPSHYYYCFISIKHEEPSSRLQKNRKDIVAVPFSWEISLTSSITFHNDHPHNCQDHGHTDVWLTHISWSITANWDREEALFSFIYSFFKTAYFTQLKDFLFLYLFCYPNCKCRGFFFFFVKSSHEWRCERKVCHHHWQTGRCCVRCVSQSCVLIGSTEPDEVTALWIQRSGHSNLEPVAFFFIPTSPSSCSRLLCSPADCFLLVLTLEDWLSARVHAVWGRGGVWGPAMWVRTSETYCNPFWLQLCLMKGGGNICVYGCMCVQAGERGSALCVLKGVGRHRTAAYCW